MGFKLHAILSNMMKSHCVLLHPTLDVNHTCVQHVPARCRYPTCPVVPELPSWLSYQLPERDR